MFKLSGEHFQDCWSSGFFEGDIFKLSVLHIGFAKTKKQNIQTNQVNIHVSLFYIYALVNFLMQIIYATYYFKSDIFNNL